MTHDDDEAQDLDAARELKHQADAQPKRYATHEEMMADKFPEEEAAASPNYDADMKLDAQGIAEMLRAQVQAVLPEGTQVTVKTFEVPTSELRVPEPTLGSIRAALPQVEASFVSAVTEARDVRENHRNDAMARAIIQFLHSKDNTLLREFARTDARMPRCAEQLSDAELLSFIAPHMQRFPFTAVGLGVYVGALLIRNLGLSMDEIVDCATDPSFAMHVLACKAGPDQVSKLALDVIEHVEQASARRARATGN